MREKKFGNIEIFGYIGILIWVTVIFLRSHALSTNGLYLFLLNTLPNLGAAWASTMFGKWIIVYMLKRKLTRLTFIFLCIGIFVLALISEIIHDLFLNSPFDIYDIIITAIAQLIIFLIPKAKDEIVKT